MRVAVLADSHIDHGHHGLDGYEAWTAAANWNIDHGTDLVIVAGDLFHRDRPTGYAVNRAADTFRQLTRAGIKVLIVVGNHEWIGAKPAGQSPCLHVETFRHLSGVKVVRRAEVVRIPGLDLRVAAIAWPEPTQTVTDLCDDIARCATQIARSDGPTLAAGHLMVSGASTLTQRGTEIELWQFTDEPTVPVTHIDLPDVFRRTVLGHIHRRQPLSPTCGYVGSTEALGFGDGTTPKGFTVLDWHDPTMSWTETFVPVSVHRFLTVTMPADHADNTDIDTHLFDLEAGTKVRLIAEQDTSAAAIAHAKQRIRDLGGHILQTRYVTPPEPDSDADSPSAADSEPDGLAHHAMSRDELLQLWYPLGRVPTAAQPHVTTLAGQLNTDT